jgi:hypothetical protein
LLLGETKAQNAHAEAKKNNAREVCTEKRREEFQTTDGVWELSEDA